jgi:archaellum component FlaC
MKRRQRSLTSRPRSNGNGLRSAHRQSARPNGAVTSAQFKRLSERVEEMESELNHIRRTWDGMGTSRQGVREQIERNGADLGVQFQRIAMMRAEIDRLKANETALHTEIDQLSAKNPPAGRLTNGLDKRPA